MREDGNMLELLEEGGKGRRGFDSPRLHPEKLNESAPVAIPGRRFVRGLSGVALALLAACGGGGTTSTPESGCSGAPLSSAELAVYRQTAACAGLSAPEPRIQWEPAEPCPGAPDQLCLPGAGVNGAGIRGHYRPPYTEGVEGCPGTLYIADPAVVAHEMVHHLLFHAGRPDYRDHTAAEFACGGELS